MRDKRVLTIVSEREHCRARVLELRRALAIESTPEVWAAYVVEQIELQHLTAALVEALREDLDTLGLRDELGCRI